tara:strand:- start:61 stop:252 length:192 start_codon:yes stop_codon:yes gene_type:complete
MAGVRMMRGSGGKDKWAFIATRPGSAVGSFVTFRTRAAAREVRKLTKAAGNAVSAITKLPKGW